MEKQLQVAPVYPEGWYSSYTVFSEVGNGEVKIEAKIKTIGIYTYKCLKCNTIDGCNHTTAVREYIMKEMDAEMEMEMITQNDSCIEN